MIPVSARSSRAREIAAFRDRPRCWMSGSAICRPTRSEGFKDVNGSWNTAPIRLPSSPRRSPWVRRERSRPSNAIVPASSRPPDPKRSRTAAGDRALAGTGLSDERHRLAALDLDRDVPHGLERAGDGAVGNRQPVDRENGGGAHSVPIRRSRGSRYSRRPSPSRFTATTVMHMAKPGASAIHGARPRKPRA